MKNEIYRQICEKQEAVQQQIKEEVEKLYGGGLRIRVRIDIHDIPNDLMPDGSEELTSEKYKWLHYSEGVFAPALYGQLRKFKIVFIDEPDPIDIGSSIGQPKSSNENPVTSTQP